MGETSGISVEIQDAQGIQYFYAHMSAWAEPINVGDRVHVGQVLGYLGHTGNAIYTPPHLHLEYPARRRAGASEALRRRSG